MNEQGTFENQENYRDVASKLAKFIEDPELNGGERALSAKDVMEALEWYSNAKLDDVPSNSNWGSESIGTQDVPRDIMNFFENALLLDEAERAELIDKMIADSSNDDDPEAVAA